MTITYIALFVCFSVSSASGAQNNETRETVGFPLGIADLKMNRAFIACSAGIEAIDLRDGRSLWTYLPGRIVLASKGGILTALAGGAENQGLSVVFLRATDGNPISSPKPLRVPSSDVRALLQLPGPPEVELESNSLYMRWQRNSTYSGGANPPGTVGLNVSIGHGVEARIDLSSGESELDDKPVSVESVLDSSDNSISYVRGFSSAKSSWKVSPYILAELVKKSQKGQDMVGLVLRDATRGSASTSFKSLGAMPTVAPYVTADGKYVLLQFGEKDSQKTVIYSALTGEKLGTITGEFSVPGTSIIGPNVYYNRNKIDSSVTLEAARLASGNVLWQRRFELDLARGAQKLYQ